MGTSWKKVTDGLFGGSATAVNISPNGTYFLEADGNGIYRKEPSGPWSFVKKTYSRHRHIYCDPSSKLILTCGDRGSVLVSFDDGLTWTHRAKGIPSSTLWTIVAINENTWLTHSSHSLYYSNNQGFSWMRLDPFYSIQGRKPEIRTISVTQDGIWLLGTKVHPTLGGLWALHNGNWKLINKERFSMISSINFYDDHLLIATGSCRSTAGRFGCVKALNLKEKRITDSQQEDWFTIHNDQPQRGYLDIHTGQNHIYVAAYGDGSKEARGGVFRISWKEKKMIPVDQKKGHVWRVAASGQEWISAGVHSVESSCEPNEWFQGFQNLNVSDMIVYDNQVWIATSNEGILNTENEFNWSYKNEELPYDITTYQFQSMEEKLYLQTDKGVFVREKDQWICCIHDIHIDTIIFMLQGQVTLFNKYGLWRNHDESWKLVNGFEPDWQHLYDAASNGEELMISTEKGIFHFTPNQAWTQVPADQDMVKFVWLNEKWFAISKEGQLYIKADTSWILQFPYQFKIFNILPDNQDQYFLCTNKGLFISSLEQPKMIKSIFVCPNISNAMRYKNKYYVSSYSNGLWTLTK